MRRDRILTTLGLVASLSLAPAWAAADVIPPDVDACRTLSVGAACGGGMSGVPAGRCQNDTCTRLDYANWNRDAMAMPPTMNYACVRCVAGGTGDGGPSVTDSGTDASTAPTPSASSGGCSVGSSESVSRRFGPWLLAGLVWAVFLGRRRREG